MKLDPQAGKLNRKIKKASPAVMAMLSKRGKAIYFPKLGILAQTAEAKGAGINATIGIALDEDGQPACLPCLAGRVDLPASAMISYAPSPGRNDLRQAWQDMLVKKNPSLAGKNISRPVVTSALTHGLSMAAYLFCDRGDSIILPDMFWENYELIFSRACGAVLDCFPLFSANGGFNVAGLREKLLAGGPGKRIVCLNFPNNPTGYTPTVSEVKEIKAALLEASEAGSHVVVLLDDAYFGLVYEPDVYSESIFGILCDLHPNLLALKLDAGTKEDYVWGFRVGFMTYGIKGATAELYESLLAKTSGAIRGNISNASNLSQSLLVNAYSSPEYDDQKREKFELLRQRYKKVKEILAAHPEYREQFVPVPFNSGYFMCVKLCRADPEKVRQKLLRDYSTGVIAISGVIRLAFSSTPTGKLEGLLENLYQAARSLG